jgi:hypothetical protein
MALLGVDHLALTAPSLAAATADLGRLGYDCAFTEPALLNHEAKAPFLSRRRPTHDIGLFRPQGGGVAIEAVIHGPPEGTPGLAPYRPVLAGGNDTGTDGGGRWPAVLRAALGVETRLRRLPESGAEVFTVAGSEPPRLIAVTADVADPAAEAEFWAAIGWRIAARDEAAWIRLELPSPVPSLYGRLVLAEVAPPPPVLADAPGFPCLAFLCNRLDEFCVRLAAAGATVSAPFTLAVNGQPLSVVLFRTPGGLIGEVIHPQRPTRP